MCSRQTVRFDCDLQIDTVKAKLLPFHQETTTEGYHVVIGIQTHTI